MIESAFVYTQNIHQRETVVESHAQQESGEGEHGETVGEGRDDSGQCADQVAQHQRRNAAVVVGDEAQQQSSDDAAAEEQRLRQRRLSRIFANPVILKKKYFISKFRNFFFK